MDIRGKGYKLQEENYVHIDEVGTIGTKEMEGPDKNRKDKHSYEISKNKCQFFFSQLFKKVQEQEMETGQIRNVFCVNSSFQGQLEHLP